MRRLIRLMWYVRPYWLQLFASVVLFSLVGLLEAFRLALFRPIFDRVLTPEVPGRSMALIRIPHTNYTIYLENLVPHHFHNPWTVVAFALVASVPSRAVFDYAGTYLVNYAGFGLVTDLRNEIYGSVLRRSAAFFQKHPTGTLVSAIINDIDKVQFAMSSVLAEFLQQFFIFIFTAALVISAGRQAGLGAAAVCAGHHGQLAQDRPPGARHHPPRTGQAGRDPEHPARDHHRPSHRQSLQHGALGDHALQGGGQAPVLGQHALRGGHGRQLAADGPARRRGHRPAAEAGPRQHQPRHT